MLALTTSLIISQIQLDLMDSFTNVRPFIFTLGVHSGCITHWHLEYTHSLKVWTMTLQLA